MTTFGDSVYQRGGQPVGSAREFDGWFDANVFFVDYDDGTAGVTGKNSMSLPGKHLRIAIDEATSDDTIYLRPRKFATGTYAEDPQVITPDTAANWAITSKPNLSIIGTGKGLSHAGVHKCWIGGYSGITTAVITINSPGCVIENLRAAVGASTSGIFASTNSGTATEDGGNTTIYNCEFHDAGTAGALNLNSTWQMSIIGNRFLNCDKGIYVTSSYSVPQIWEVSDNIFQSITTDVYADFHALGGLRRFTAQRNYHANGQPAGGAPNKYYCFSAASTGMISGGFFGTNTVTEATAMTLDGVLQAGNHCMNGLIT